jgi:hypothetical protein
MANLIRYLVLASVAALSTGRPGLQDYKQGKVLCGYGGSRANCVPIDGAHVATFVADLPSFGPGTCFLTDTAYALPGVSNPCAYLKHYGNGVITFATGGIYQYTDHQSSRHQ